MDFLSGLSRSIIHGISEVQDGINDSMEEGIEKFRIKLFITRVAISIAGTGFFLTLWGIASPRCDVRYVRPAIRTGRSPWSTAEHLYIKNRVGWNRNI